MKKIIFASFLLASQVFQAQEAEVKKDTLWTKKGVIAILGSQSSFSQWQAGGANNVAINGSLNYDINYKKADWVWDNKFIASYGINKISGQDQQKTDDRLEINSVLGKKAKGEWYYSAFTNFKTQFDVGLNPDDQTERISHFMSPAFWQTGLGMLWKKNDNFKVNIAPATARFIFVHKHFTDFKESFGVEQGKSMRFELGASVNAYYKVQLMENFSVENILNLYSNYLEDPQNVDVDYQLNAVLKVNKYISTNLTFQALYDDNAYKGFQTRHTLGVGLNYIF
ncbi:DUF3078 domain-containing protein [Flavobacterium sp. CBA20B-1]|uniref:DUF3078 domain-containing protein n=1 Tax=unclassified Flavobacterium TaxID=196869 RepID=UPI002224CAC0|nr:MULTISPECIES: DUF3078 domain-containing protein [unclassified Flavobacterium]WCM41133.1 DUF3078 domain-containing protein [Flavobacterium sp. CBA20B-1]